MFTTEVKAPDANILALQDGGLDKTSNISRASSVTSEIRKVAKRVNASSRRYEIPLLHEAMEINYSVIHEPMHKRTMIIFKEKSRTGTYRRKQQLHGSMFKCCKIPWG